MIMDYRRDVEIGFGVDPGGMGSTRSNPTASFSPTDLAGLKFWLKADALSLSDGNPVATWADASGSGNDATGSGTTRPLFKSAIQNSLPVVRFDGVDDVLSIADSPGFKLDANLTVFVVQKAAANYQFFLVKETSPVTVALELRTDPSRHVQSVPPTGTSGSTGTLPAGAFSILGMTRDSGTGLNTYYINGTASGTESYGATSTLTDPVLIGTRADNFTFLDGDIAEMIAYNAALSDVDRGKVETYLTAKWGL